MEAALSRLTPRLRAVAELVPAGASVADVGTDHAYLLAWLRARGRVPRAIGIDVVEGPLRQARQTLSTAQVSGVELRRGDGLQPLRPGEVEAVVLAGMGGARVVRLLDRSPAVVAGLSRLVLQPNTDWAQVRGWVMTHGRLLEERMVEDRGKYYVVLAVQPGTGEGQAPRWSEDQRVLGPRLLEERPEVFEAWLRHELRRVERALVRAERGRGHEDERVARLRAHRRRITVALDR